MKKILLFGITLTIVLTAILVFVLPSNAATEGYYTYTVSKGGATITDVNTSIKS